jgi:hypothetical protein
LSKVQFDHFVESPIWSLCRKSNLITLSKVWSLCRKCDHFVESVITLSKVAIYHFVESLSICRKSLRFKLHRKFSTNFMVFDQVKFDEVTFTRHICWESLTLSKITLLNKS